MTFRGVAWDIDGTLVDSEPLHHRILIEVCLSHGLDLRDDPVDRFLGVHVRDVWTALAPDLSSPFSYETWMAEVQDGYVRNAADLKEIPGAGAVIRAISKAGIPQVAVSNSGRPVVNANLDALGVRDMLVTSISLDDVSCGKPAPEPYLRAAEVLDLPPCQVLAVEDSTAGANSALAAGMTVAFLSSSAAPEGTLRISSLSEVPAILGVDTQLKKQTLT